MPERAIVYYSKHWKHPPNCISVARSSEAPSFVFVVSSWLRSLETTPSVSFRSVRTVLTSAKDLSEVDQPIGNASSKLLRAIARILIRWTVLAGNGRVMFLKSPPASQSVCRAFLYTDMYLTSAKLNSLNEKAWCMASIRPQPQGRF